MKEKHFIINLAENLVIIGTEGTINRNSNSSQWLDVSLDGWKLNEGEVFFITLEHYDDDTELPTRVGPLQLFYNSLLKRYVTLAPPEFVSVPGLWNYSIELRFNFHDISEADVVYNSLTSAIGTLNIVDSIVRPSYITDNIIKETELISAAQTIADNSNTALEAADRAAEAATEAETQADRAETNAELSQTAAEEAKAAAQLASSKAVVIWGFNQAVDITDLEWEVE